MADVPLGLAISHEGEVIDLPEAVAVALVAEFPSVGRERRKWAALGGASGRVILIQAEVVTRAIELLQGSPAE